MSEAIECESKLTRFPLPLHRPQSCWGCRFAVDVTTRLQFHTMLDAGTGNGALVRLMREQGKNAYGIELSKAVLEKVGPADNA